MGFFQVFEFHFFFKGQSQFWEISKSPKGKRRLTKLISNLFFNFSKFFIYSPKITIYLWWPAPLPHVIAWLTTRWIFLISQLPNVFTSKQIGKKEKSHLVNNYLKIELHEKKIKVNNENPTAVSISTVIKQTLSTPMFQINWGARIV